MNKKILYGIAVLAIAAVAAWNVNLNSQNNDLSDISLANVEALAEESSHKYETKKTDEIEVLDEATDTYKKVSVTVCEGTGIVDC
jgi:anti-sigma regulatory factor (Ser/Thr protein kinase)